MGVKIDLGEIPIVEAAPGVVSIDGTGSGRAAVFLSGSS